MDSRQKAESIQGSPFLFQATNGSQSCLILGTNHELGLEVFPKSIQNLLLSFQKLLIERINFSVPEMVEDFFTLDKAFYLRQPGMINHFAELSDNDKNYIKDILQSVQQKLLSHNMDISQLKDELIFGMLFGVLSQGDAIHSMDVQLRERYKRDRKQVVGLEETKDLAAQIIYFYNMLPEEYLKNPYVFLTYYSMVEGNKSVKLYLSSDESNLNEVVDPAVAERNNKWFYTKGYSIKRLNSECSFELVNLNTTKKNSITTSVQGFGFFEKSDESINPSLVKSELNHTKKKDF